MWNKKTDETDMQADLSSKGAYVSRYVFFHIAAHLSLMPILAFSLWSTAVMKTVIYIEALSDFWPNVYILQLHMYHCPLDRSSRNFRKRL